jgi:hypothetical protein
MPPCLIQNDLISNFLLFIFCKFLINKCLYFFNVYKYVPEIKKFNFECWVLVAHTYDPSYLSGRDQEDHSSKPA